MKFAVGILLLLTATVRTVASLHGAPSTTQSSARLQLRLVAGDEEITASESLPSVDPDAPAVHVLMRVELDDRDVESAKVALDKDGRPAVSITMTDPGTEKLAAITERNIDRRLAFVFDGKVLCAPTIRSKIGRQAMISVGKSPQESDVKAFVEKLNELIDERESHTK